MCFSSRHPVLLTAQQFISDDYSSDIFTSIILQPLKEKVKGVFPKCSFWKIKHVVTFHPARQILMRGSLSEDPTGSSYQNYIKHLAHLRKRSCPGSKDTYSDLKSLAVVLGEKFLSVSDADEPNVDQRINWGTFLLMKFQRCSNPKIHVRVTAVSIPERFFKSRFENHLAGKRIHNWMNGSLCSLRSFYGKSNRLILKIGKWKSWHLIPTYTCQHIRVLFISRYLHFNWPETPAAIPDVTP